MKNHKYLFSLLCGLATLVTACTNEDSPQPKTGDFLTATATAPANAFGNLARALPDGYSDLNLHYQATADAAAYTAFAVADANISDSGNGQISFTTKGDGTDTNPHLIWQQLPAGANTFYLTVSTTSEEKQLWGTCTATNGTELAFGELKPRHTKLSVAVTVKKNGALTASNTLTVSGAIKAAAETATDASIQAWPTTGEAVTTPIGAEATLTNADGTELTAEATTGTATVTGIFAPQTLEEPLCFEYDGRSWTLDLSKIAVSGGIEGQKANRLVAGQHLTVSVTLNLTTLGTPTVTLTDISAATDSYTGSLTGVLTYNVTYGETTEYMTLDELLAFIQGDANTDITITGNITSFAEEAIANAFLASTAADLAVTVGKIYCINGSKANLQQNIAAAVSAGAKAITVLGNLTAKQQAAVKSGIENGTGIHLSLPQTTAIGKFAFELCSALTAITLADGAEIGDEAFAYCTNLATVNGTLSGTIGVGTFYFCSALTEITLGDGAEIGDYAFYGCTGLATVNGTLSATIGKFAFELCSALTAITLVDGAEIGDYSFYGCTGMTSLMLKGVVTEVGLDAFFDVGHNYDNDTYNCTLILANGQKVLTEKTKTVDGEEVTYYVMEDGAEPVTASETQAEWAGNTWKSITIASTNE